MHPTHRPDEEAAMQGSIGVVVLAGIAAVLLVAGTSAVPPVLAICAVTGAAVTFDRRRTRAARR